MQKYSSLDGAGLFYFTALSCLNLNEMWAFSLQCESEAWLPSFFLTQAAEMKVNKVLTPHPPEEQGAFMANHCIYVSCTGMFSSPYAAMEELTTYPLWLMLWKLVGTASDDISTVQQEAHSSARGMMAHLKY